MTTAFYLFSNLFHIYAMYIFSNVFFDKNKKLKFLEILFYVIYYAINSCAFIFYDNTLLNLASNVLPFFAITMLYKSTLKRKLSGSVAVCCIAIICDLPVMTLQSLLKINSIFFSQGFVSNIIFISVINITVHRVNRINHSFAKIPIMYYITVLSVPFGTIILGYFVAVELDVASLICSVILIFINLNIYYLYESLINMFSERQEKEFIEKQNEAYQNQLRLMQQSQLAVRCLKHDMDNHILKMQNLLNSGDYKKLKEYLSNTKAFMEVDNKVVDSGNELLDSIFNYKLRSLNSMDVEAEYDIYIPEDIGISSFDMNVVVGNLLDNAVEALMLMPKEEYKRLLISIRYQKGYVKIIFGNSFDGTVVGDCKTRKWDSENHGIGLKSVEMIVEKYGGLLKTEFSNKWFEVSAILYET